MNREKWDRAGEVFERALELEPEARDAFVVDACAGDAMLLAEVRAFLAAYETESFLERPSPEPGFAATQVGDRILTRATRPDRDADTGKPRDAVLDTTERRIGPYR